MVSPALIYEGCAEYKIDFGLKYVIYILIIITLH